MAPQDLIALDVFATTNRGDSEVHMNSHGQRRRAGGSARAGRQWKGGRCLRIGVVVGGTIVEERLLSPGAKVTIGSDPSCTVVLHGGPRKHTLLESRQGGGGHLHSRSGMRGKVTAGPNIAAFSGKESHRLGPLDKGKVRLGETTVLFQFVRTPPTPQGRRRGARFGAWRWQSVDWIFFAVIIVSGLFHTAAFVWVNSKPPPSTQAMRDVVDRFIVLALESAPPPVEAPEPEADGDGDEVAADDPEPEAEPGQEDDPEPVAAADEPPPRIESAEERRERLREEVSGLGVLGTTLDKPGSKVHDLLADGSRVDGDVRDAVAAAGNGRFARRGDDIGLRDGGGDDRVAGSGDMAAAGGGDGGTVQKRGVQIGVEEDPGGWEPPTVPGSSYDVRGQLRRYMGRFKGCYEKEIKNGADIEGKIVLAFVVEADGAIGDVYVESDSTRSQGLQDCIVRGLRRAVLTVPPDGEIEVEGYPLLFSRQ